MSRRHAKPTSYGGSVSCQHHKHAAEAVSTASHPPAAPSRSPCWLWQIPLSSGATLEAWQVMPAASRAWGKQSEKRSGRYLQTMICFSCRATAALEAQHRQRVPSRSARRIASSGHGGEGACVNDTGHGGQAKRCGNAPNHQMEKKTCCCRVRAAPRRRKSRGRPVPSTAVGPDGGDRDCDSQNDDRDGGCVHALVARWSKAAHATESSCSCNQALWRIVCFV